MVKKLKPLKGAVHYSKKMFTRRAKPFRIISDPDNQRPDKRSSTVLLAFVSVRKWILDGELNGIVKVLAFSMLF